MSEQTDIAVRRLIEMTKAGEIEWSEVQGVYAAEVTLNDTDYIIAVTHAGSEHYVGVNGGRVSLGAGYDTPEAELYQLAESVACQHAEFLRDIGATP